MASHAGESNSDPSGLAVRKAKTFCRNCSAHCAMEIDIVDGRLDRLRSDGMISPYGAYLCPKGLASVEFHNGAEARLFSSLERQENGSLAPVDTAKAIDAIGAKLADLVARHGPRSVAVYHGTGAYRSGLGNMMERAWVSALGTPNFFTTMTIDQSGKLVAAGRMGVIASGKHAIRDADLAILCGGNPVVTHQGAPFAVAESGAPARSFETFKARGGRLIIIDPRRSETARFADLLIQPLPGHDAAIFAAIAHILLRDGSYDASFVARHCGGLEALRQATQRFTPELVAQRADVPVEEIEQAAWWLSEAKRPIVGSGTGPSMGAFSNLAETMVEVVGMLAGGFRRAGDLVRNPGTLKPKVVREMAVPPSRGWEQEPKCLSEDIGQLWGEMPSALIPREIMADHPDRIRALIVFGGDPLMAMGDPAVAKPAFEHLELLVSLDCRMNETGKLADYVVACSQPFERHELTLSADALYPEAFAQYSPPLVAKPAGVVDDWEFFWMLAARMGLSLTFKYWGYGLKFEDIALGMPLSFTEKPTGEDLCRFLCSESAVPFEELAANAGGVRPQRDAEFVQPAPDGWTGRTELCPDDVAAELVAVLEAAPEPEPFRLTCRRVLHAMNGAFRDSRANRSRLPVNFAYMNPDDMADLGLVDDDGIEITSRFGKIRGVARGEARLRRRVVSMTHMFGTLEGEGDLQTAGGSNVGRLTSLTDDLQPINFMPRFSALPITVSPL